MGETAESELGQIRGWSKTLKFAVPSIAMMMFISTYSLVDGAFVSNFVGTDALASINILMPLASLLTGMGFMFATGGSAYVANLLGKGEAERANRSFSEIALVSLLISSALAVFGFAFMDPLVGLMGADETLSAGSAEYGRAYIAFAPFVFLQFVLIQFLIVAERPGMSFALSVAGGLTNLVLDWLFICVFGMGLTGAAIASGIGSAVPSLVCIALFFRGRMSLRFSSPSRDPSVIVSVCSNGMSEMASELAGGLVVLCYNTVMMRYMGPDGVSAITIVSYAHFLALAAAIGYSNGVAPVMSYDYGKGDRPAMGELFRISMAFIGCLSVVTFAIMEIFASNIAEFFAGDSSVTDIMVSGAAIYSIGFLFMCVNVYASSLFTSLSNGRVSAAISVIRSVVLLVPLILLLPEAFGIDAIWFALPLTEFLTACVSVAFILRLGGMYGYLGPGKVLS